MSREDPLSARLLGAPAYRWRDTPVVPASRKGRALLLALCLCPEGMSRASIAELLWGVGRHHNVRQELYAMARLPGAASWLGRGEPATVRAETDVAAFTRAAEEGRLQAALDLWNEPTTDLWGALIAAGPAPFADWASVQRERLLAAHLDVLSDRAVELDLAGEPERALRAIDAVVRADPLNESAHRRGMELELRLGRRPAARERFDRCRRTLLEELGVEPLPQTRALIEGDATASVAIPVGAGVRASGGRPAPFIGRAAELDEVAVALRQPECLVVSVVGEGGSGKTRLALEAAERGGGAFEEGAVFVPLASVRRPAEVPSAIAEAVGLRLDGRDDAEVQILAALAPRQLLLVVDNLEHVLEAAGLVVAIAEAAPRVRVLCTSRTPIGAAGEHLLRLAGLPRPAPGDGEDWRHAEAVRLFESVAQRSVPRWRLREADRTAIERVLEVVDGLPLAIELAAPWLRSLTPDELADELERSVHDLRDHAADGDDRHASMRGAFEHSWRLLPDEERGALADLAVFRGPFDRRGAERVAGASLRTLLALDRMSLLRRADGGRFEINEVIRSLAWPRASDPDGVEERHANYVAHLVERLAPRLSGPDAVRGLEELGRVLGDVRAAWTWATLRAAVPVLTALSDPLYRYLEARGLSSEGWGAFTAARRSLGRGHDVDVLRSALRARQAVFAIRLGRWAGQERRMAAAARSAARAGSPPAAAFAAIAAGMAAYRAGDLAAAEACYRRGLAWAERSADDELSTRALEGVAAVAFRRGEFDDALRDYRIALELARSAGDPFQEAQALVSVGMTLAAGHDVARGRRALQDAVAACRRIDEPRMLATALNNLGRAFQLEGNLSGALAAFEECSALRERVGDPRGAALAYANLGHLHHELGNRAEARAWLVRARDAFDRLRSDAGTALTHNRLGRLDLEEGRVGDARRAFVLAVRAASACGDVPQALDGLAGLGYVAQARGRRARAAGLYELVAVRLTENGATRGDVEARLAALSRELPASTFERARRWGRAIPIPRACDGELRRARRADAIAEASA